eukprot:1161494-Pelagomonas_calceolata.AAC.4
MQESRAASRISRSMQGSTILTPFHSFCDASTRCMVAARTSSQPCCVKGHPDQAHPQASKLSHSALLPFLPLTDYVQRASLIRTRPFSGRGCLYPCECHRQRGILAAGCFDSKVLWILLNEDAFTLTVVAGSRAILAAMRKAFPQANL